MSGRYRAAAPGTEVLAPGQLLETQQAFDSVAADYDGPRGNNELIQRMRTTLWNTVRREVPPAGRLLDLGCGTGIDAAHFAADGFEVLATDWSPQMTRRVTTRALERGLQSRLSAMHLGIHELERLDGAFDGIYSNFGPLNCVSDLRAVAAQCARLLRPGGKLVFSVIGRLCPWELWHYAIRGRFRRALVRTARHVTAVGMNGHTIWTYYYRPREFYAAFAPTFSLQSRQALSLFLPPPYLVDFYRRHRLLCDRLGELDDRLGTVPLLRDMGDHFLIVMRRR